MKRFFAFAVAFVGLLLLPFAAMAVDVQRSSMQIAGQSAWAPVLRLSNGDVIGLNGVTYAFPVTATIDRNTLMYQDTAVAWVRANYGRIEQVEQASGGGGSFIDLNNNGVYDPGEPGEQPGAGSW